MMNMMEAMMYNRDIFPEVSGDGSINQGEIEDVIKKINKIFVYSMIWTVCSVVDGNGRGTCASFLKKLLADKVPGTRNRNNMAKLDRTEYPPDSATYYEFFLNEEWKWKKWEDELDDPAADDFAEKWHGTPVHEIVVENIQSLIITHLLQESIDNDNPILIIGPTGTGKTIYTMRHLKKLPRESFQMIFIGFSA